MQIEKIAEEWNKDALIWELRDRVNKLIDEHNSRAMERELFDWIEKPDGRHVAEMDGYMLEVRKHSKSCWSWCILHKGAIVPLNKRRIFPSTRWKAMSYAEGAFMALPVGV